MKHNTKIITSSDVIRFYTQLEKLGIKIWIDGGWGVDALIGEQTRPHGDLDIAIQQKDVQKVCEILQMQGYQEILRHTKWNFVMGDDKGREIDFHAFVSDEHGQIVDGIKYPEGSLTGTGTIDGHVVNCISPEHMVKFHTGYPLRDSDFRDVEALCRKFNLEYPNEYQHLNEIQTIKIEKYNNQWPELFRHEAENIFNTLFDDTTGENYIFQKFSEIHHIGSTAIPGMASKPIIDILLECDDVSNISLIEKRLSTLGYENIRRNIIPHYTFFTKKRVAKIPFHLHIMERGDPQVKRHIHFRDYLIHHSDKAKLYEKIKNELAEKFTMDRNSYTFGKSEIIQSIDREAKVWNGRRKQFLPPNTDFEVGKSSEKRMLNAIEANITVHMTHFEQYLPMVHFTRCPGYTSILNEKIQDENFNYILDSEFNEENSANVIAKAARNFEEKSLPFCWWVFPSNKKTNINSYLEKHGFKNTFNNTGMYFDLNHWDGQVHHLENFIIKRAVDKTILMDFSFVLSNDSEFLKDYFDDIAKLLTDDDPMEYYVGYLNGIPISCGLICFYGRVAGLHCLTTSPPFRQKGYGTAIQQFRLKRAKDFGYKTAILQASGDKAKALYLKLGWRPLGQFREFKRTAL